MCVCVCVCVCVCLLLHANVGGIRFDCCLLVGVRRGKSVLLDLHVCSAGERRRPASHQNIVLLQIRRAWTGRGQTAPHSSNNVFNSSLKLILLKRDEETNPAD